MKKLFTVLVVVLLMSNIYLGYEVYQLKQRDTIILNEEGKEITHHVSSFETDVTKVVEKVSDKAVSVIVVQNNLAVGSGSGVVYKNENGTITIITNHHVVEGAQKIYVRTSAGEEIEATLLGSDPYTDLALLSFESDLNVEPFTLGDSSLTKVGEFVAAIGSPLGIEFSDSTTFGIISGKDRVVPVDLDSDGVSDWDMVVLQTDAAINPGNSGGALVNMKGELIGINSLKISSDNVEGMGFSIPINEVIPIVQQLESSGKVNYPIFGVSALSIGDMNEISKAYYGIPKDATGVYVSNITRGTPADIAGIQEGDRIIGFDNTEIKTFKEFRKQLYSKKVGDRVTVVIVRDGKEVEIEVVLK